MAPADDGSFAPYLGLTPYGEKDAPFFFGRGRAVEMLCDNLLANRVTLLYGPSGVGKSSVLLAGVASTLRRRARQNLDRRGEPEFVVVVHRSWRDDPVRALCAAVEGAAAEFAGSPPSEDVDDLAETVLRAATAVGGDFLVVLDQMEEYFTYHLGDDFAVQLGRAATRSDVPASFLLSIREDALWRLDALRVHIPSLFDNAIRARSRPTGRTDGR